MDVPKTFGIGSECARPGSMAWSGLMKDALNMLARQMALELEWFADITGRLDTFWLETSLMRTCCGTGDTAMRVILLKCG